MSLADDLKAEVAKQDIVSCKFCRIIESLDSEDRAAVERMGSTLSADTLARLLRGQGFLVSATRIRTHRRDGHTP